MVGVEKLGKEMWRGLGCLICRYSYKTFLSKVNKVNNVNIITLFKSSFTLLSPYP
jgi:hypothetical protein